MSRIEIFEVHSFELAYNDQGSGSDRDAVFYNPVNIPVGFNSLGSYGQSNYDQPSGSVIVVKENESGTLAHPIDFDLVWNDQGSGGDMDGSFWKPVPPEGYVALGILCVRGYEKPPTSAVVCVREDLVVPATIGHLIWNDQGSGADRDGSFYAIEGRPGTIETGTFAGVNSYDPANAAPLFSINPDAV